MIRRLRVRGYKSLRDCSVELAPLTVVFGPNGSGKSNLLDLIHLMSRFATKETARDAFEGHRGNPLEAFFSLRGFGRGHYEDLVRAGRLSFDVECDLELHPRIVAEINQTLSERERSLGTRATYTKVSETLLRYRLEIGFHPATGELLIEDESLRALRRDLAPKAEASRRAFFEREADESGRPRFVARVERQSHPRYFEPHRPRTLLSELSDPVYHPHVVAAAREIGSWRVHYVEPAAMRTAIGVQSADDPGRHGELLAAFYYTLQQKQPATLAGITRNLKELVPGLAGVRVDVREGLLEMIAVRTDGAEFPARLLSEGTLRLLCILGIAVANSPPSVVVYEEPENGVNPSRLERIAQIIRNAVHVRPDPIQFLLTTHSPLLCDLLPEHLLLSSWDPSKGTTLEPFAWDRDSLYFQKDVLRALDDATERRPGPDLGGIHVAEDAPD